MKVEYINHMGDDLTVVNAARVSFDKESDWEFNGLYGAEGKGELSEKDQKLIKYLASHNHWTPYSHVMITMRETVPIFVSRQRFKHMVGFTYNEVSRRYVDDEPEFYIPDAWRKRAENKKQGSSDENVDLWEFNWHDTPKTEEESLGWDWWSIGEELKEFYERVEQTYRRMIEVGVAPEQARMILPQSMYTSYYVTGSLAAWARAYKLRIDPHAQKEIQDLAKEWRKVIDNIPELEHSWSALIE